MPKFFVAFFCLSFTLPVFAAREKRTHPPSKREISQHEFEVTIGSDPKLPAKSLAAIEAMQDVLIRDLANWPFIDQNKITSVTLVFAHSNGPLINTMFDTTPATTTMSLKINGNKSILVFWDRVLGRADSPLVYVLAAVAGELYMTHQLTAPNLSPPRLREVVALQGTIDFLRYLYRNPALLLYSVTDKGELEYLLNKSIQRFEALRVQPEFAHADCRELLKATGN